MANQTDLWCIQYKFDSIRIFVVCFFFLFFSAKHERSGRVRWMVRCWDAGNVEMKAERAGERPGRGKRMKEESSGLRRMRRPAAEAGNMQRCRRRETRLHRYSDSSDC